MGISMPRLLLLVPHGQRDTYRVRELNRIVAEEAAALGIDYEVVETDTREPAIYIEDSRSDTTLYIDEDGEESEETIRMMIRVLATIAISMDSREVRETVSPYIGVEEEIRRR